MKKRIIGLLLGVMLVFGCVGCGAESKTTEPTETATATTIEESTTEQIEEATATPEKTAEPTPDVKEEPSEETTAETESEATEPAEKVEPEPMEEPTPEPQAIYTYTDMSATMYVQQTVNVRDLPDTRGNKIGSLSTNDEITISGQCNETGWYRFEYNGNVAFVSNKYVSERKVEVVNENQNANSSTTSNNEQPASASLPSCPYPLNVWTAETSPQGCPMYVAYTKYNCIGDICVSKCCTPDIMAEKADGTSIIWDTICGYASANNYSFHFLYPCVKVGTYAEGTIYKCTASAHFYQNAQNGCPNFDANTCQPGTISLY